MNKKLTAAGIAAGVLIAATAAWAQSTTTVDPAISHAEAIEIALAEIPGAVMETELERDDATLVYEIEIITPDGAEMEIEIDAETGAILEVDAEDDDQDGDDDDGDDDVTTG